MLSLNKHQNFLIKAIHATDNGGIHWKNEPISALPEQVYNRVKVQSVSLCEDYKPGYKVYLITRTSPEYRDELDDSHENQLAEVYIFDYRSGVIKLLSMINRHSANEEYIWRLYGVARKEIEDSDDFFDD